MALFALLLIPNLNLLCCLVSLAPERCLPFTVLCWYNDINSSLANHLNNTVQTCHHSVCCCYNHLWGHLMIIYYCTGKTASGERTENHPGQSTINSLQQWHSEGWAWPGACLPKVCPTHVCTSTSVVSAMVKLTASVRPIPMTWLCHWSASCTN